MFKVSRAFLASIADFYFLCLFAKMQKFDKLELRKPKSILMTWVLTADQGLIVGLGKSPSIKTECLFIFGENKLDMTSEVKIVWIRWVV